MPKVTPMTSPGLRTWVRATDSEGHSIIAEDNHDGTFTTWGYGAIGQTGELLAGVTISPTTKQDKSDIDRLEKMLAKSEKRSQAWYNCYRIAQGR